MSQVSLIVKAFPQVVAGKFVDTFVVIDQTSGELIGKKAHKTEAEAQVELGNLKFFAEGLNFARAVAPAGSTEKGLIGKANVVAAYLLYKEQVEAGTFTAEEVSEAEAEVEAEAPVAEEEAFEG
ncbi:hypothetical protein HOS47_gp18 [Pseudomonas phage uligo]|uniref:Uncharacterized protein n=1 Tax=Pseudomonas phage uligo TaxID=2048979 RepID=A0A2H4P7M9_9CAUD|nr:hypothetical protein HOS47_gp18 [Pseudomonas phage uligo]ATW58177.1 hypothetical protein [Pseudomonas phage uligo]